MPFLCQDCPPHLVQGEGTPAKGTDQECIPTHPYLDPSHAQCEAKPTGQFQGRNPAPLILCDPPTTFPCPALLVDHPRDIWQYLGCFGCHN